MIQLSHGVGEEAMVIGEVAVVDGVAGDNQIGDIAMPHRQNPTRHGQAKRGKARFGKDG